MSFITRQKMFYTAHLKEVLLPYWIDKVDREQGGFFTCYDVMGKELHSKDKFVWSQGRCVWLYATLSTTRWLSEGERQQCRQNAKMGAEYLQNHCILSPQGDCAFVLNAHNRPFEIQEGAGLSPSTFADCFVSLGLSAAARALENRSYLTKSQQVFENAFKKYQEGSFMLHPATIPADWRAHAPAMILLNTAEELHLALCQFGESVQSRALDAKIITLLLDISEHFMQDSLVCEYLGKDNRPLESGLGRLINPGHTNESMWFVMESAGRLGEKKIVDRATKIVSSVSTAAWDSEYGGMYYYLDRSFTLPREDGTKAMEEIVRDCQNKIWWPHTETLFANLLCYSITGEERFLTLYKQYHNYTFKTFPGQDKAPEWIHLRTREGAPILGTVGGRLPVKDPYHIMRNLIKAVEVLERL